jgi:predicted phosphodiesterase
VDLIAMRVFALSDIHVDYEVNARWVAGLSTAEYRDDVLILAGDVSDSLKLLRWTLTALAARFRKVLYVPGNHDLWVIRDGLRHSSFDKFEQVRDAVEQSGASMQDFHEDNLRIVPLLSWYDYSFGSPSSELRDMWMDYHACLWPHGLRAGDVARHFEKLNRSAPLTGGGMLISFSHFLPRMDLLPQPVSKQGQVLYPVLGSARLDEQVRALGSAIHVYGHSHVNQRVHVSGITYVNNAFGYPRETRISSKQLLCIHP